MNEDFNATHTQKVKVATEVQQKIYSNYPVKFPSPNQQITKNDIKNHQSPKN